MADIRPFRALRYNLPKAGDIRELTCPPYDIISPGQRREYLSRNSRNLIRLDGHTVPEVLEAILRLYPLDPYVKAPVALMEVVPGDTVETPIWDVYQELCDKSEGKKVEIEHVERFAFYERAKKAYCVIMTGETALYANIILKKGVVTE